MKFNLYNINGINVHHKDGLWIMMHYYPHLIETAMRFIGLVRERVKVNLLIIEKGKWQWEGK